MVRERAYAAYIGAGQPRLAALVATELSMDHFLRGAMAV